MVIWENAAKSSDFRLLLSSPSLIVSYFVDNISALFSATYATLYESIMGLLLAVAVSFGIMIICFYIPKLMEFVLPIMITSQVIPLITLAPLFILIFGIGYMSKIMMAALICFFPIFINFANGARLISKNIHELMYIYNASKTQMIFRVYFPLSMPQIMSGLKVAATLAVIGAIVAEFNGTEIGLGKNLFLAAKRLEPELMMSSLLLSALLGGLLYLSIYLIEFIFGKWYLKN
ncbi:MAG: ABC transporter permease subunit [Paludibacter sp.]|nr:ABC transporter permease subunit [Paludibacter sp.]